MRFDARPKRRLPALTFAGLCVLAILSQSSCLLESLADQGPESSRDRVAKAIIVTHKCGTCHTLTARGLRLDGSVGPDLSREGLRGRSDQWLRRQLVSPREIPDHEVVAGFEGKQRLMPPLRLTDPELDALVEFLNDLR